MNAASLGDLVDIKGGGTPSRNVHEYFSGQIPWVTVKDFKDELYISESQERISEKGLDNSASNLIPPGTVLLVTRMAVGKAAIARMAVAINQDIKALKCSEKLHPEYLLFFLQSKASELNEKASGATVKGITIDSVENLKIPLPSYDIQHSIAQRLKLAYRLRRLRRTAHQMSETIPQSIFLEMFGDPAKNPKKWTQALIDDVVQSSQYGTSKKSNRKRIGYPVLGMGNITESGHLDLSDLSYVELSGDEFRELRLQPGDIIFNRTNSSELVGKTSYWQSRLDAVLASYLIKIKLKPTVLPEFFSTLLNTHYFKGLFQKRCKKAVGQSNISPTLLKEFKIYVPPMPIQRKFASIIFSHKRLLSPQREAEKQAGHLFQTLLHRTFETVNPS